MKRGIVGIFVLGLSMGACGSDDDSNSGGSSGNAAAAVQSCQAYCDASEPSCGNYASAAECKSSECTIADGAPAACTSAIKALYDCQKAAADICFPDCSTQGNAVISSCS
jgi:hypothetical protein